MLPVERAGGHEEGLGGGGTDARPVKDAPLTPAVLMETDAIHIATVGLGTPQKGKVYLFGHDILW